MLHLAGQHEARQDGGTPTTVPGPAAVHLPTTPGPLTARAEVTLPSVSWVRNEACWVSAEGRVQAFAAAYPSAGEVGRPMRLPSASR